MTTIRQMLVRAQSQFTHYAQNHRAKAARSTDPAVVLDATTKAETNEAMSRAISSSLVEDAEFPSMVERLQKPGEDILEQMTPLKAATLHMACGAAFESGELGDAVKRWVFYGKDLDITNVIEELGDIEFYLEGLRQNLGISRDQTLAANVEKLQKGTATQAPRYGDAYSDAAAIMRADKLEPGTVAPTPSDPLGQGFALPGHGGLTLVGVDSHAGRVEFFDPTLDLAEAREVLTTTPSYFSDLATIPARERYIRLKALVPDNTSAEDLAVMVTNLEAAGVEIPR